MKSGNSLLLSTTIGYNRRLAFLKSSTPASSYIYRQVMSYSNEQEKREEIIEERAPSTAQILKKLEEEKVAAKAEHEKEDHHHHHGSGDSTVEKGYDGADVDNEEADHAAK